MIGKKMTSRDFCFWLQGIFEGNPDLKTLSADQVTIIKNHLNLAFIHDIDPSMGDKQHQKKLNAVHSSLPIGMMGPPGLERPRC